jgi:hypothetical protein
MLALVATYSSEIQQPVRATAALGKHPRTRQAGPSDREQHRAGSLHPEGHGQSARHHDPSFECLA